MVKDPKIKPVEQTHEQPHNEVSAGETKNEPDEKPTALSFEDQAKAVLTGNDQGGYIVPARGIYPHQWLWDSCFAAIGICNYDIERAQDEIFHLLRGQWSNGMLPHMVLQSNNRGSRDARLWRSWLSPYAPDDILTSGITQPPMLAEAVTRIGAKLPPAKRREWYKAIFSALLAYHKWLYAERDPRDTGLVMQIHPWETGLDNTPPWMSELHEHFVPAWVRLAGKIHLDKAASRFRHDTKFAPLNQRLSNLDGMALYALQRRLAHKNYDFDKIMSSHCFKIEDLTFNCILIRANQLLKDIAGEIHKKLPANLVKHMELSEKALEELWEPTAQEYFSRDFASRELIKIGSVAALMPLYAGCVPKDHAERIVRMLENDHLYGPAWPVPSVPISSEWFKRQNYWQGPTWININWFVIDGLRRAGFDEHAAALCESTLELVEKSGLSEYFDPISGEPAGAQDYSWTAALSIDLLNQKSDQ